MEAALIEELNILDMPDDELDAMTQDDMAAYTAELWESRSRMDVRAMAETMDVSIPLVAVGDSWFDYQPAGFDILDFLQRMREYQVLDHGEAGDTVENMAYGTEFRRRGFRPRPPRLDEALDDLRDSGAMFFLLSGGGNDVAGPQLEGLLNHAETGLPALRADHVDYLVDTVFRGAFEHIFKRVWAVDPNIQIIGHGYGNAIPDGRAVIRIGAKQWIGPWLRPALTRKRILRADDRQAVVTELITRLNDLLKALDQQYPNYHAIDARAVINHSDWENELHLKDSAFRRVAMLFHDKIASLRAAGI
ncbi:MAG: hypothetical protein AAFS13_06075 [Pseudomonadota bacterium]